MYILNKCTSFNQSKKYWNTPIHLENNGPSTKVPWIFWFLIMAFNFYVSITSCGKLVYIYICLAMNEVHIKLASLIICLINYNLTNTSSTPPPELKKDSIMYSKFDTFVYLKKEVPFI